MNTKQLVEDLEIARYHLTSGKHKETINRAIEFIQNQSSGNISTTVSKLVNKIHAEIDLIELDHPYDDKEDIVEAAHARVDLAKGEFLEGLSRGEV